MGTTIIAILSVLFAIAFAILNGKTLDKAQKDIKSSEERRFLDNIDNYVQTKNTIHSAIKTEDVLVSEIRNEVPDFNPALEKNKLCGIMENYMQSISSQCSDLSSFEKVCSPVVIISIREQIKLLLQKRRISGLINDDKKDLKYRNGLDSPVIENLVSDVKSVADFYKNIDLKEITIIGFTKVGDECCITFLCETDYISSGNSDTPFTIKHHIKYSYVLREGSEGEMQSLLCPICGAAIDDVQSKFCQHCNNEIVIDKADRRWIVTSIEQISNKMQADETYSDKKKRLYELLPSENTVNDKLINSILKDFNAFDVTYAAGCIKTFAEMYFEALKETPKSFDAFKQYCTDNVVQRVKRHTISNHMRFYEMKVDFINMINYRKNEKTADIIYEASVRFKTESKYPKPKVIIIYYSYVVADNIDDAIYCKHCGAKLESTDLTKCPFCNAALAEISTERLWTITDIRYVDF